MPTLSGITTFEAIAGHSVHVSECKISPQGLGCGESLTASLRTKLIVRLSKALFYQGKFEDCASFLTVSCCYM